MAKPLWLTPAGSLGTIPEGLFYKSVLSADTPALSTVEVTATSATTNIVTCSSTAGLWAGVNVIFSGIVFGGVNPNIRYFVLKIVSSTEFTLTTSEFSSEQVSLSDATGSMTAEFKQHVRYRLQSGSMPQGIQIGDTGLILGIPKAVASFQGVPSPVGADVTSKFTVRAYTRTPVDGELVRDGIADRTFNLTVTGEDFPNFVTPAGSIGTFYDGTQVSIQLEFTDDDPGDTVICSIVNGELPAGLTLSTSGLISGYIEPVPNILDPAGFDLTPEYSFPYDFLVRAANKNYQFTVEISDGKESNIRTFTIYVYSRDNMTADSTDVTADNTFVTADQTPQRPPLLLNTPGSIGTVRHDNFFGYKFNGIDLDGNVFEFLPDIDQDGSSISDSTLELPPGTELDPVTGWLYGYIPNLGVTETTYNFGVYVRKTNYPDIENGPYMFSLTVIGSVDTEITWLTPQNLGTIKNGATSTFYVEAVNAGGRTLTYALKSGSNSSLPQGLKLLESGEIVGRVSFNTYALDGGTTTFDKSLRTRLDAKETTFDMVHKFTIHVTSADGLVSVFRDCQITVDRVYNEPYENLYIKAMPPQDDRKLLNDLLQDKTVIDPSLVYRINDPNFGVATSVKYWHAFGLNSSLLETYVEGLCENHYRKSLVLGKIETAQALDASNNVMYEVVYSRVIDDLVNNDGESVSKSVNLKYPVDLTDSTEVSTVYPNSLYNMRQQVIDTVGQVSGILPQWMISKQENGQQLGFVPAWVICYTKPGFGKEIAYNINKTFGIQLNKIDFDVDRYELDRTLSIHWDPIADSVNASWIPEPNTTTFDDGDTVFDGNSLKFISPVDMYTSGDGYDKYLVFPKRNILT